MRHPLPLANLLTGVGVALIAENALALIVVPTALIAMYRITVALEDAWLAERFGRAYLDYCARVPALPRIALPTFAAVWSAACLAFACSVSLTEMRLVTAAVGHDAPFRRDSAICASCRRQTTTLAWGNGDVLSEA